MSVSPQDAENTIQNNLNQIIQWLQQIEDDNNAIQNDNEDIQKNITHHRTNWGLFHTTWTDYHWTEIDNDQSDIKDKKADIDHIEEEIKAANTNGQFSSLLDALKSLIDAITQTLNNPLEDYNDSKLLVEDLKTITTAVGDLVKALKAQVQEEIAYEQYEQDIASGADSNTLNQDAEEMVSAGNAVNSALGTLLSHLDTAFQNYNTESTNADVDKNGIRWYDKWFSDGDKRERDDNRTIDNATTMENLISAIQSAVSPALASVMNTDMQAISMLIERIKHEIDELLSGSLTPAQREQAAMSVNADVMTLFLLVTGLLALCQQDATKDKSQNEATMSKATTESSQMGITKTQAQQRKIEQDMEYAKTMGTLMSVFKYTMMALMTILAPGVGTMLMSAALIVLEATGAIKAATDAIASSIGGSAGQIVADVTIGVAEILLTLGGGAAIDALLKTASKAAMTAVKAAIIAAVKAASEEATEQVTEQVGSAVGEAVKQTIERTVQEAAEAAAIKTFMMSMSRNGMSSVYKLISATGRAEVQALMVTAAKEAAQGAADESVALCRTLGEAADFTSKETIESFASLTTKAADKATATAMKVTEKKAAEFTQQMSKWQKIGLGTYAATSTNLLVDVGQSFQNKFHLLSDAEWDKCMQALQMIEQILQMIAQLVGSGVGGQAFSDTSTTMSTLMKVSSMFNIVPALGESASSYGTYEATSDEADATKAMGMLQTVIAEMMQLMAPQISKRQQAEAQSDNQIFMQEMQSIAAMAHNSHNYINTVAQVLQA